MKKKSLQSAILEAPNDTGNYILMSSRYRLSLAQLISDNIAFSDHFS
jgi:hypothetical protein